MGVYAPLLMGEGVSLTTRLMEFLCLPLLTGCSRKCSKKLLLTISSILDTFLKYDLLEPLDECIDSGYVPSLGSVRSQFKQAIGHFELNSYIPTCLLYRSIPNVISCSLTICMYFWWRFASANPSKVRRCKLMTRLLYGETCLKADSARFNECHYKVCPYCIDPRIEDTAHLLFECESFSIIRHTKWNEVIW